MAKIIIKANLANDTISFPFTQVQAVKNQTPEPIEIFISPKKGYQVDAVDFSHGFLPNLISSIRFSNSKNIIDKTNKVIALVSFRKYTSEINITNIDLPLSFKSRLSSNKITITETSPIDKNIFVSDISSASKESSSTETLAKNIYTVEGQPGIVTKIFSKTISIPNSHYFTKTPSYKISGNTKRYTVSEKTKSNNKGQVISKTFDVSVGFPMQSDRLLRKDSISFSASVAPVKNTVKTRATKKEEYEIYSVDTGKKVGPEGGVKKISIKGLPGTKFKLLTQDGDGNTFNKKTGLFSNGDILEGVIPSARPGFAWGEFKQFIKIPASASASNVVSRVMLDKPIDHTKITSTATADELTSTKITDVISGAKTLTLALRDGGPVDTSETPDGHPSVFKIYRPLISGEAPASTPINLFEVSYIANGTHSIGPGKTGGSISSYISTNGFPKLVDGGTATGFSFIIASNGDDKFLRINRQPKFDREASYRRWDFATQLGLDNEDTKNNTSGGLSINTDWGTSIRHSVTSDTSDGSNTALSENEWVLNSFDVELKGIERGPEHGVSGAEDANGYRYILLNIKNITGEFGTADLTIELNLKNFLSTYTGS